MTKIMFIKDYIDIDKFGFPLLINVTTIATLIDQVTGRIILDSGIELEFVDSMYFAPLRDEFQEINTQKLGF